MQAVILLKIQIKGLFFPGQYLPVNTTGTSKTLKPWVFRVIKILSTNGLKLFLSCLVPFPVLSYSFSLPQWNPAQPNQGPNPLSLPTLLSLHAIMPHISHSPYRIPLFIPWICYERSFNEFYLSIWNQLVFNQRLQLFVQSPQPHLLIFAWTNWMCFPNILVKIQMNIWIPETKHKELKC